MLYFQIMTMNNIGLFKFFKTFTDDVVSNTEIKSGWVVILFMATIPVIPNLNAHSKNGVAYDRHSLYGREVRGSRPTAAMLCPWARHFTPRKYWLIIQEAMAPSRHDWKIVDWDVKPQHNQPKSLYGYWKSQEEKHLSRDFEKWLQNWEKLIKSEQTLKM